MSTESLQTPEPYLQDPLEGDPEIRTLRNAIVTSRSLDADGNNRIEYTELVAGLISYSDDHLEQMLWTVFTSLDRDQNGALDVHEIKRLLNQGALHNIGLEANEKEIEKVISTIDKDKSGTISFSELKEYFLRNK
jgi:calcium-dependent protein kinase